jgi:hypothetical protein
MMSTDYKTTPAAQPTGRRITIPDDVPARYRSRTLTVKLPDYLKPFSFVQLAHKTTKKKEETEQRSPPIL